MTRFARAKGSKSSNEKKPEEATSWLEMKNSMITVSSKNETQLEEKTERKIIKSELDNVKWASFNDDESNSLLNRKNKYLNSSKPTENKGNISKKIQVKNFEVNSKDIKENVSLDVSDSKILKKSKLKKKFVKDDSKNSNHVMPSNDGNKIEKKSRKRKLVDELFNESDHNKRNKNMNIDSNSVNIAKLDSKNVDKNNKMTENLNQRKKFKINNNEAYNLPKKNKYQHKVKKNFKEVLDKKFSKKCKTLKNHFSKKKEFDGHYSEVIDEVIVNGEKVPIVHFQGFPVTKKDAERLKNFKNQLIEEGTPKDQVEGKIKLERRRAEKALSRLKKAVCFNCREAGHLLSSCPLLTEKTDVGTGVCYKCGSTEHVSFECKVVKGTNYQFAECFICKEQGHIAWQCPDNPRGLYPRGGACRECGDVTHLRRDCPKILSKKSEEVITVGIRNDRNPECLDEEIAKRNNEKQKKPMMKKLKIKF